jgi:ribosome-interacting GTPase 1
VLANKCDDEDSDEDFEIFCELLEDDWSLLPASAKTGRNLELLSRAVFEQLGIIRIYSKAPGNEPDFTAPFVMKKGGTLEDFAGKIHKDFVSSLKAARVWGEGVFDGQMVRRDHVLHDGDVVELHA